MQDEYNFILIEIPVREGSQPGITFIVSNIGQVFYTREYTRHVYVQMQSMEPRENISWGGVLTAQGKWIRKSYEFGDAPSEHIRQIVVKLIASKLK
jgi:hypothetical protein